MEPFDIYMDEYRSQMKKGVIPKAYKGLMDYMQALKTDFSRQYPNYFVSGSLYFGYMDMTYFSFSPEAIKRRKLKIAIVFMHESCHFEVWLSGYNKQVQAETWQVFKDNGWSAYHLVESIDGMDSIVESVLVENPDFSQLDLLTHQIEDGTIRFIRDMEGFLDKVLP